MSDPRNYLYLEAKVDNQQGAIAAIVRLKGDPRWFTSNLGRADYALERSGWVRTTVELPPGTQPAQIGEIGFQCVLQQKVIAGGCRVEEVSKAFLLDREYRPGASFWALTTPVELPSGRIWTSGLK